MNAPVMPEAPPTLGSDERWLRGLIVFGLVFLGATEFLSTRGLGYPPHEFATQYGAGFLDSALVASTVVYLFLPWNKWELSLLVPLGIALEAWQWHQRGTDDMLVNVTSLGVGMGTAALIGFLVRIAWTRGLARREAMTLACLAAFDPLMLLNNVWTQTLIAQKNPMVFDRYAYALDSLWHAQPSFLAGHAVATLPWLSRVVWVAYVELPMLMLWVRLLCLRNPSRTYVDIIRANIWIFCVGELLYNVFPAVGPPAIFSSWPTLPPPHLLPLKAISMEGSLPRNCMPSLHFACALSMFWGSLGLRWNVRLAYGCFLALTVISTLGVGGHYGIDLVVAVPFCLLCQALSAKPMATSRGLRRAAIGVGALFTAVCLLSLRMEPAWLIAHPRVVLPFEVFMVTVAVGFEKELRESTLTALAQGEDDPSGLALYTR